MLRRLMEDEEYGQILYPNGDFYEGSCKKGSLQDGYGRYVWKNGNEYVGEWKNGVLWGRGVLIWSNGNRYDGFWENGVPKGNGVFTWPDGACYVVSWNDGFKKIQHLDGGHNAMFYFDAGSKITSTATTTSSTTSTTPFSVDDLIITTTINRRGFPRICVWKSDGEFGDITCDIVDDFGSGSLFFPDGFRDFRRGSSCFFGSRELKRPGHMIAKGHKNYELMLNLQLGIRYSVGKCYSSLPKLRPCDFDPKEKFWTRFPPEGSKYTPPHQSVEFWWKDYCPMVFRHLRKLFGVDSANYMMAICGNGALRELSSPGKSGSFFYLTQDDRFMVKTLKKSEVKVLIRMLSSYYKHVRRYSNTLVTKIFGVHCIKRVGGQKTRFIIMGNLFCSDYPIHRRFDLKGSSYGRITEKPSVEIDETTTLKDLDLNFRFRLHRSWLQEFIKQINRDCEFLEAERIMDYSLLVGLHFCDVNTCEKMGLSPFLVRFEKEETFQNEKFMYGSSFLEAELQDTDGVLAGRKPLIRLGVNMPARAEKMTRSDFDQYSQGDVLHLIPRRCGETYDVVLYFGIIDILQDYDIIKKLEHAYKSLQADPTSISAVDPKLYSKRFRDFISRIFIED